MRKWWHRFGQAREDELKLAELLRRTERFLTDDQEQNKLLPEAIKSAVVGGLDCDVLPNAHGEFGRSPTNPIPVNGPIGEVLFISRLRTGDGIPMMFHRAGTHTGARGIVDAYELLSLDGRVRDKLFLSLYHPRKSKKLPSGYRWAPDIDPSNPVYGVNWKVEQFPAKLDAHIIEWTKGQINLPLPTSRVREHLYGTPFQPSFLDDNDKVGEPHIESGNPAGTLLRVMAAMRDPRREGQSFGIDRDGNIFPLDIEPTVPESSESSEAKSGEAPTRELGQQVDNTKADNSRPVSREAAERGAAVAKQMLADLRQRERSRTAGEKTSDRLISEAALTPEEQEFLEKWFPGKKLTPQQINLALEQGRALGELEARQESEPPPSKLVKESPHDYGYVTLEDFHSIRINPDVPPYTGPGFQPSGKKTHDIEMHEVNEEFAKCWHAALEHIERQVQGCFTGWLKHTLAPPFLEHLSFRLGNQLFFVRIEIECADVAVPGSRDGLHYIAKGCKGHACIMPMRLRNEVWSTDAPGWGLLDARTGTPIDPPALITDQPIEMTDWELHDFCVQFVRDHLERSGKAVTSWQSNPAVDPSIWTAGKDGPEWIVVRSVRYPRPKAARPKNWDRIAEGCARLGTTGYFASVAVANADDAFAPDKVPVTPLWRGHGLRVAFAGLEPGEPNAQSPGLDSAGERQEKPKATAFGNVVMTDTSQFEVLGLVSLTPPGPWWWHTEDLNEHGAQGAVFRCYEQEQEIANLFAADVTNDPTEPDISSHNQSHVRLLDAYLEREVRNAMERDGRKMVRWMTSELNQRAFGNVLVTAYIGQDQGRERQYIDLRFRVGERKLVVGGCFDKDRADVLMEPIGWALSNMRPVIVLGKTVPAEVKEEEGKLVKTGPHHLGDITDDDLFITPNFAAPPFPYPDLEHSKKLQKEDGLGRDALPDAGGSGVSPRTTCDEAKFSIISEQRRKELLAQAPKRENFPDEESYEEAKAGYRHQVGPLLRQYATSPAIASSEEKPLTPSSAHTDAEKEKERLFHELLKIRWPIAEDPPKKS